MTANNQNTTAMTTDNFSLSLGNGLSRMTDNEYEQEYANDSIGTPRPNNGGINADVTVATAYQWSFSQSAKHAAAALKRRRSPHARTYYCMAASQQVKKAFDTLQQQIENKPELMSRADFQLLKQAISNFRVNSQLTMLLSTKRRATIKSTLTPKTGISI